MGCSPILSGNNVLIKVTCKFQGYNKSALMMIIIHKIFDFQSQTVFSLYHLRENVEFQDVVRSLSLNYLSDSQI